MEQTANLILPRDGNFGASRGPEYNFFTIFSFAIWNQKNLPDYDPRDEDKNKYVSERIKFKTVEKRALIEICIARKKSITYSNII